MLSGIVVGSLFSVLAILVNIDVSFWVPPLVGVVCGFIAAIWYLNKNDNTKYEESVA
jgi:hypothetical protein